MYNFTVGSPLLLNSRDSTLQYCGHALRKPQYTCRYSESCHCRARVSYIRPRRKKQELRGHGGRAACMSPVSEPHLSTRVLPQAHLPSCCLLSAGLLVPYSSCNSPPCTSENHHPQSLPILNPSPACATICKNTHPNTTFLARVTVL